MGSSKKRVRNWTQEDRAAHRVFEKSRREALNDSLIDLARQVPSLASTRRLNKHMIVDHSIARLQAQRQMCLEAANQVATLIDERNRLLAEVNRWRTLNGIQCIDVNNSVLAHLSALKQVETEVFGRFPNGFGDNMVDDPPGKIDCHGNTSEHSVTTQMPVFEPSIMDHLDQADDMVTSVAPGDEISSLCTSQLSDAMVIHPHTSETVESQLLLHDMIDFDTMLSMEPLNLALDMQQQQNTPVVDYATWNGIDATLSRHAKATYGSATTSFLFSGT